MGILNALNTAVSGLTAQSYALENISGNIANSQTVGFKRVDTSFMDMIPDSPNRREIAGSVMSYSQLTNTVQGTLRSTGINTNMALNGSGFFVVQQNTGSYNSPAFNGQNFYTRRGDFTTDANGYLVNGAGKFLVGSAAGAANGPIKISAAPVAAQRTTSISYQANLPSYPKTTNANTSVAGSELLSSTLAAGGTISGADQTNFLAQSINGGDVTVYDAAGKAVTMQTRWAKVANASAGGSDTWQLYYQNNSSATGTAAAWTKVGSATFTAAGQMTSGTSMPLTGLSVNGTTVGDVTLNFGSGGLTQYSDSGGQVSPRTVEQDGYSAGTLTSIGISSDGRVVGSYTNGQIQTLAQVVVANFAGDDALKRVDGGTYAETVESGSPSYGEKGWSLTGGAVEMSNTDISDEFSKMIVTQQAYSANTRVMSTAQQMLQDVINVVR